MAIIDASRLSDAQARNLVLKALRKARAAYRSADTKGELLEREFERLITRKTRINSGSLVTLSKRYGDYQAAVTAIQIPLTDAFSVAANF